MSWLAALMLSIQAPAAAPIVPYGPTPICEEACTLSPAGAAFIRRWEGYSPVPYKDVAGLWTVGVGHLIVDGEDFDRPLTPAEADELLARDAGRIGKGVNRRVTVALQQHQFDAVMSFTFNVGEGALAGSTLLKRINAELHDQVPGQLLRWNKARVDGILVEVPGLTNRRRDEGALYVS